MAVTATIYTKAYLCLAGKKIDFLNDTIKAALLTSSYTPDRDNNQYWSDIVANESSGTGYTAGGLTLTTKTATPNSSGHYVLFGADDLLWSSTTIADARYCVFYDSTGTNSTSCLISYIDFGSAQSTSSQPFAVSLTNGIFKLTAS